jgi:LysM repeat protein
MRAWTKSACVVLAWTILSIILVTVGMHGSVPSLASTRTASNTEVHLMSTLTASAERVTAANHRKYVVQDGDTLTSIAARLAVRGGWRALYSANRHLIGPNPNLIRTGTVLVVPAGTAAVRYTVMTGNTLSGIAAEFAVAGGWHALYAANRPAVGPDPDDIQAGTALTIPGRTGPSPASPARARTHPPDRAPSPAPPAVHPHRHKAAMQVPVLTGMPKWLKLTLLAVGLLILAAFAAEIVLVAVRRRRSAAERTPAPAVVGSVAVPSSGQPSAGNPRIVFADHDRLVITRNTSDDSICVLRPPDQDPRAILRVARLVLPERRYGELAEQLGLPVRWPME